MSHRSAQNANLGPNPSGFDWAGSADVAFYRQNRERRDIYFVEVIDRHFGRVLCTENELMLSDDRPLDLVKVTPTEIPLKTYLKLIDTATDAVKEHL